MPAGEWHYESPVALCQLRCRCCSRVPRGRPSSIGRSGSWIRPTPANAFPCFHAAPKLLKASIGRRGGHPWAWDAILQRLIFLSSPNNSWGRFRPIPSPCGRPAAPGSRRCWPERLDRGSGRGREKHWQVGQIRVHGAVSHPQLLPIRSLPPSSRPLSTPISRGNSFLDCWEQTTPSPRWRWQTAPIGPPGCAARCCCIHR